MRDQNPRGRSKLTLNGKEYVLRLTVGAAMDLEEHFGCTLDELETKLKNPSMRDLAALIRILTKAGGEEISEEDLNDMDVTELEPAISKAFFDAQDEKPGNGGKKKTAKKSQARRRGGGGKS